MNHVITNPRGIDIPIQRLQTLLHEDLDWSADSDFYGRALKVNSDTGYLPRGFVSGQGYTDVFTDDRKSAKLFFLVDDDITSKAGLLFTAQVKIVVMANIEKIFGQLSKRADTDLQEQVIKAVRKTKILSMDKGGIETGIETIFRGYDIGQIKKVDLNPYHVFAVKGTIKYHFN